MLSATYVVFIRHLPGLNRQRLPADNGTPQSFDTWEEADLAARGCAQQIAEAHGPGGQLVQAGDGLYLVDRADGVACAQVFVVRRSRFYRARVTPRA